MRKIRNKIGKDEPILNQISDIYAEDIYAESASNPTSRFEDGRQPEDEENQSGQADVGNGSSYEDLKAF